MDAGCSKGPTWSATASPAVRRHKLHVLCGEVGVKARRLVDVTYEAMMLGAAEVKQAALLCGLMLV